MGWKVSFTPETEAALAKLGTAEARRILKFLHDRLQGRDNPKELGEALKGTLREFWRYLVGDYRIICRLENETITILVVQIGHRQEVYKKF